jgi:phosphatidylglycerophosphate synthase
LFAIKGCALFVLIIGIASLFVRAHHPFDRMGPANGVTAARAALAALVAGFIGEPNSARAAWFIATTSGVVIALDGVDGWLARRTRLVSAFGARFDMEVDALLILALSLLAWQYDKAGGWIALAGLMRYGFVAAGWIVPRLRRPLPPSRRRQLVCVVQVAGLSLVMLPGFGPPVTVWISAGLFAALSWSFLVDVMWLLRGE